MVNKYYQKNEEKLGKEACERYQNLFEEEKGRRPKKAPDRYQNQYHWIKHQYHCDQNKNLSEEEKKSWVCEKLLFST